MALEIIGAGLGRTGTVSTKAALEILGFGPCYHMREILQGRPGYSEGHLELWSAYARGEGELDWKRIFERYSSSLDHPTCFFYKELMEAYPEAKVVLNVRDSESWFRSWKAMYDGLGGMRFLARFLQRPRRALEIVDRLIMDGHLGGPLDHDSNIANFERHNREVIDTVPPDRLLVFDVKQGWSPLCKFLGVEEPTEPFPHLNETKGSVQMRLFRYWLETTSPTAKTGWALGATTALLLLLLLAL